MEKSRIIAIAVALGLAGAIAGEYRAIAQWVSAQAISTIGASDTTPPIISAISGTTNLGVTTITWVTDEPTDSTVEHGSTASYGYVTAYSSLVTNHSVTLNVGIGYGTTYYYRIKSKDQSGNLAVSDQQTILVPLPSVPCTDSDNGISNNQKGIGTGIYAGAVVGYHKIYGQEPDPITPKATTNDYSTFIDHCSWDPQHLNEAYCDSSGKLQAAGIKCPNGCKDGVCVTTADSPPSISVFVKSANELHPTAIYAGLRAYYSVQASDDKGLASVTVNAPGMKYSGPDNTICNNGAKTCAEPVYIIVPSAPGEYTVTVKATDTAGQVSTKIVMFTAQGCAVDSECGGTYFPSSGATFCDVSGSLSTKRMKYGIVSVCAAGTCDEKSAPAVLEDCGVAGKMCGFSQANGGQFQCVPIPSVTCALSAKITAPCLCGPETSDGVAYGYCCSDSSRPTPYLSPFACAPPPPQGPPPPPVVTSTALTPAPSSLPASATPSVPATVTAPPIPTVTITPHPAVPSLPAVATSSPVAPSPLNATSTAPQLQAEAPRAPLSPREIRAREREISRWVKQFARTLSRLEKKVRTIERKEIVVDPAFKQHIAAARELARRMKDTKDFEEKIDLEAELGEIADSFNDYLPTLEILARLPDILQVISRQAAEGARLVRTSASAARRLGMEDALSAMETQLDSLRSAAEAVRSGEVALEEMPEYIEERITEKLEEIRTGAVHVRAVANVRQYVNRMTGVLRQIDRRIRKKEKAGEEVEELLILRDEAKANLDALRGLAGKKLREDTVDQILLHLRTLSDAVEELESRLSVQSTDALERELQKLFSREENEIPRFASPAPR